ncbi:unnamed protein product, partial [Polarella glacialis]
ATACGAALSALERCGRWAQAVALLGEFRCLGGGATPGVVSFSAVASACSTAGKWTLALQLFQGLRSVRAEPDVVAFGVALGATGVGGLWPGTLQLLAE